MSLSCLLGSFPGTVNLMLNQLSVENKMEITQVCPTYFLVLFPRATCISESHLARIPQEHWEEQRGGCAGREDAICVIEERHLPMSLSHQEALNSPPPTGESGGGIRLGSQKTNCPSSQVLTRGQTPRLRGVWEQRWKNKANLNPRQGLGIGGMGSGGEQSETVWTTCGY